MDGKSTDELKNEIKEVTDIEDFLSANSAHLIKESLSKHLHALLSLKNLSRADVIRGSLLGRAYVYRIFAGQKIRSEERRVGKECG